jgi:diacylglycerol kinase family enzyme
MSILAISNAKARSVAKQGSALSLKRLPENSEHFISQDRSDLMPLMEKAREKRTRHILIEGGDGTVRTVMTALLNSYDMNDNLPAVSILPSGTTNQIARNIGLKDLTDLRTIQDGNIKAHSISLVKIDRVKQDKSPTNPLYGFLFSTGALPHISRFAQEKLNGNGVGGGTAVVGAVLKAVTGDKSRLMPPVKHKMKARLGGQTLFKHKGVALGTIMTTLPSLMLGLDPFWGEEEAPLRMTWAEADSRKLGRNVAGLWMGRKQDRAQDGYYSHNIDRLTLKTTAPATLDGDFLDFSEQKLRISASRPVTFWRAG